MERANPHQLTIGEYAAATQLTAKALRLYDEQGLIKPGAVAPETGYRYYRIDQVTTGRLVRALRDMNLSLLQIRQVLDSPDGLRPALLRDCLRDAEQRLASERAAYQSALLMMRSRTTVPATLITEMVAPEQFVALVRFTSNRRWFLEHALQQLASSVAALPSNAIKAEQDCAFSLLEPLSDEDSQIELMIPIDPEAPLSNVTTRRLSSRRYIVINNPSLDAAAGIAASTDVLFDWFDRKGVHALGFPEVVLIPRSDGVHTAIRWAFDSEEATVGGSHD